jgi:hypothetical protein
VALLEEGSEDVAGGAEALLGLLAGGAGPAVSGGATPADRRRCREAWAAWWRANGDKVDLAKLDLERRLLGLRLVVVNSGYGGQGAVWEFGHDRRTRWQLRQVGGPFDARVLPGGRVLVAEYDQRRVSERDLGTNKVVWEHRLTSGPLEVERLPGGSTLIATNPEVCEVTRDGKATVLYRDTGGNIFTAQRLPSGLTLVGLYSGWLLELDRAGREVRKIPIEKPYGLTSVQVLPGGRYLIPYSRSNRVVELDGTGKVLWQVSVPQPTSAARLPGGNLLVGSHRNNTVKEIDRGGKVLWEHRAEGQVFRVRVR